ncbi:E3 ubiquitin-protein ligase goliath-like isoform X2 [Periplaneta americana]|uniref:E3 ubiquitin-protein ligase goliath-like isoform X2 n=1 Tax=Periplaneta americana TaxID=6978 RepID=UPI0037E9C112
MLQVVQVIVLINLALLLCPTSLGMAPAGEMSGPSVLEDHGFGPSGCVNAFINVTYNASSGMFHSDSSESGKYGETLVGPASGILVHVRSHGTDDPTGCSMPLTTLSSADGKLPSEPWIALIRRGQCDFAVKVHNAIRSNASAVLVYNDRDASSLDKMSIPAELRNISAVFTYKKNGESLAALVDGGYRVMIYITVGSQCPKQSNNINKTSVLFVSISFIVLMIISLAWLVFYYVQRFRYIHAKDRLSRRLCSAAKKALSKIPTKNIKSEDKEMQGDGECCAVCIEPYKISDVLRVLPCRHEFHKFCIDPWLLEHRTCPMCKMDILKHYGFVFTGSQESILHMDIEEVAGIGSGVNNDTDRLQRRTLTPASHIRTSEHQMRYTNRNAATACCKCRPTLPTTTTVITPTSATANLGGRLAVI